MSLKQKLISLGIVALFIAGACNLTAAPVGNSSADATLAALAVQASVDASVRLTSEAGGSGSAGGDAGGDSGSSGGDSAAPTNTLAPTETPQPTSTPTSSIPMVSVSVDTNCRKGPSTAYDYIGALLVGETTQVLGRLSNNQWVVVKNPDGGPDCWLWMQYATITGDLNALPVMTPPPTPTPTYTPTPLSWFQGTWNIKVDGTTTTLNVSQSGTSVTGEGPWGGGIISVSGTVSGSELKYVSGSWTITGGLSGTFVWQLRTNTNQFVGHIVQTIPGDEEGEFCGWRSGASIPSPCDGP